MKTALVIGAGPAGLVAATALREWCESVEIVEARPPGRRRAVGEHLPPSALALLARSGLAALLADERHERSPGSRCRWGAGLPLDKEYYGGLPGYGLNLDRAVFDEALAKRAEERGVTLSWCTRLESLGLESDGRFTAVCRTGDGGRIVGADLVIDASGRRAVAGRLLGARRRRVFDLVALMGTVRDCDSDPQSGRIRVETVPDGWWYAVQRGDGTLLATFLTRPELVRALPRTVGFDRVDRPTGAGRAAAAWSRALGATSMVSGLAASGRWDGRVDAFDASTQWLSVDAPEGFAAVGDAAAAWDPMASWGIAKAVSDSTDTVAALRAKRMGDDEPLRAHRRSRRDDFESYRRRLLDFYRAEDRWLGAPFWRAARAGGNSLTDRQEA